MPSSALAKSARRALQAEDHHDREDHLGGDDRRVDEPRRHEGLRHDRPVEDVAEVAALQLAPARMAASSSSRPSTTRAARRARSCRPISSRQRRTAARSARHGLRAWLRSETVVGSPPFRRTTTSARSCRVSASSGTWSATSSRACWRRASWASTPVRREDARIDRREDRVAHAVAPREVPQLSRRIAGAPFAPQRPHRAAGRVAPADGSRSSSPPGTCGSRRCGQGAHPP